MLLTFFVFFIVIFFDEDYIVCFKSTGRFFGLCTLTHLALLMLSDEEHRCKTTKHSKSCFRENQKTKFRTSFPNFRAIIVAKSVFSSARIIRECKFAISIYYKNSCTAGQYLSWYFSAAGPVLYLRTCFKPFARMRHKVCDYQFHTAYLHFRISSLVFLVCFQG